MATCPAGHDSAADDYCDTCGAPMLPSPAPVAGATPTTCPGCGEAVDGRFCESCGYDIVQGRPAAPATVTLTLGADRSHWERMVGAGEPAFPTVAPTQTLELSGDHATLGRVRTGAPVDVDLALSGPTADPAVSHRQCEFERDGTTWLVRDSQSSNGTWINDADEPLSAGETHRLADGDRILIGAWTCLMVHITLIH
jgi:hypothetical protein